MKRDREEHEAALQVEGTFSDLGLAPRLVECLSRTGKFVHPTRIQKEAVPVFLKGCDVLARSQTGSGKTLAYLLPIFEGLLQMPEKISREDGTFAIVIAPTRELVVQIVEEAQLLTRKGMNWIVPGYLIGGEKKKSEKARLRKGITLLVATPGRLLDHLKTTECLMLRNLKFLIFDEADRLLDMGFEQDVRQIIEELKHKSRSKTIPQCALFSATMWDGVMMLANLALSNPVVVNVDDVANNKDMEARAKKKVQEDDGGGDNDANNDVSNNNGGEEANDDDEAVYTGQYDESQKFVTPTTLKQHHMVVPCKQRLIVLASFLQWQMSFKARVIVFFSSCAQADFFYAVLGETLKGPRLYKLHGQMSQLDRTKSFVAFRGKVVDTGAILLCTDAAARGLDFPKVSWIVQYDAPPEPKEYIHRVGRTARMGSSGRALLFLMPHEVEYVNLMKNHGVEMSEVTLDQIPANFKSQHHGDYEKLVEKSKELTKLACSAFGAFVKSYAVHPRAMKHIFHPKLLHLGHLAKSFALANPPASYRSRRDNDQGGDRREGGKPKSYSNKDAVGGAFPTDRNKNKSGKTLANPYRQAVASEFDPGL